MKRYFAKPDVIASSLNSGTALLDLRSSKYFALNLTGQHIWAGLSKGATIKELVDLIGERFDVHPGRCSSDVEQILEKFLEADLVSVVIDPEE